MQVVEHLAGKTSPHTDTSFVESNHQEGDHDLSAPVPQERVAESTLQALEQLLGVKGLQFLAAFLRLAEAKQQALAGLGSVDCAVITTKTIRGLATRIGWGYDTTEKYLVVLCALQFVHKEKSAEGITYCFPLQPYTPQHTSLDALDTVIGRYRPKVQSFARKAKNRLLASLRSQKSPILPQASLASRPSFDLSGIEADIEQIMLDEFGNGALPQRLSLKLKRALRYRCQLPTETGDSGDFLSQKSSLASQKGDFLPPQESPILLTRGNSPKEGRPLPVQTGNFAPMAEEGTSAQKSPIFPQKGDSPTESRPLPMQTGDSVSATGEGISSQKSPISLQTGDSSVSESPENGRLSPQKGDFSSKTGDSVSEGIPNVNVITIINTLNVNVSTVALFCCTALGENSSKRGIYCKLFREVDLHVQAITAALVYTLVHREDGTIRKPQAVFYQRCKDYHREGVPEEAAALVERYGHLSYPKLLEALRQKASPAVPSVSRRETPAHQTPSTLLPLASVKAPLAPRIALMSGGGMPREDAHQLRARLREDQRLGLCRMGVVPLSDGTYAVLVDHTMTEMVRQVAFYSLQEWETRSASLTSSRDLFVPEGQEKLALRKRALLRKAGTV